MPTLRRALLLFAALLTALPAFAVPALLNFQGRLTDSSSNPLTGTYSITLSIWDTGPGKGGGTTRSPDRRGPALGRDPDRGRRQRHLRGDAGLCHRDPRVGLLQSEPLARGAG